MAELTDLTQEDFVTYQAHKVSVSDTQQLTDGACVVIYTRIWNDSQKKYDYYAIDHDGTLHYVYDEDDFIFWLGSSINTLAWDFTEYYYEGTNTPNYYYELQNVYSGKYIAPQIHN